MAGTATVDRIVKAKKSRPTTAASKPSKPACKPASNPAREQPQTRTKATPRRRTSASRPQPPVSRPEQPASEGTTAPPTPPITQAEAFAEVVRRASEGNEQCLAGLRAQLDNNPEIWRKVGDVSALAEKAWIELFSSGNKLAEESILRRQRELKADLAGSQASPLEKLLIDLVGVTWLAALHGEYAAASPPGGSIQLATYRLKRAESAQRRFARAVRTLTLVRAAAPKRSSSACARGAYFL